MLGRVGLVVAVLFWHVSLLLLRFACYPGESEVPLARQSKFGVMGWMHTPAGLAGGASSRLLQVPC